MKLILTTIVIMILCSVAMSQQPNNYDAKTKLKFGVSNDARNLYITLQSYDEASQFQIFRAGMTVSVKMGIEPKITAKFKILPIKVDETIYLDQQNPIIALKERVLLNNPTIEAKGLISIPETILSYNKNDSIYYSISWNEENAMTFTLQVPFSELFKSGVKKEDIQKKDNLLMVNINGIEKAGEMPNQPQQQRPTSLSQGGFGREGLNPERQFGTSFENSHSTVVIENSSFKHKFKLK